MATGSAIGRQRMQPHVAPAVQTTASSTGNISIPKRRARGQQPHFAPAVLDPYMPCLVPDIQLYSQEQMFSFYGGQHNLEDLLDGAS
eukprot:6502818-Karenia_brevis.AAC.1